MKYSLLKKMIDSGYSISVDILRNQNNKSDINNIVLPIINLESIDECMKKNRLTAVGMLKFQC
jgi:hypothetical protein